MKPSGSTAVMARRAEPPDSLDFFPTPPWATRALFPLLRELDPELDVEARSCWEPACGEGHMAAVLEELFPGQVRASDVFPYGFGESIDFLDAPRVEPADWIVTNPPFKVGLEFAKTALTRARIGVALLLRTAFLEGGGRWEALFRDRPPSLVAPFVERVPMVKGRWDPKASTATSYAWFLWEAEAVHDASLLRWIAPGRRAELTRPDDARRFAAAGPAPLLETLG